MSEDSTVTNEELEWIEEQMLFDEIDQIAEDLATLTPEQLHAIRMLTTYFKNVTKI